MLYVRHWLTTHSHSHRLTFGEKQLDFRRKATGVLNRSKCPKRTIPICFQGFPLLTCDMLEITHQNSGFLVFSPNNAETVFISYQDFKPRMALYKIQTRNCFHCFMGNKQRKDPSSPHNPLGFNPKPEPILQSQGFLTNSLMNMEL